ncbi:hypothetical protein [Streptomyces albireticuli]|uniref:hypothetical protein n=1 Tax=Streptomyces albireticuli TaxID=1940 RepID=UPI001E2CF0D8|nr:hypothetical protein [Streptomyces albireticuli]MCD9194241.1 hypothetical protein [Streptomyces albireticuli]
MTDDFDIDDIAAMHRQGDLGAFVRSRITAGKARRTQPPAPAPPRTAGHRPGAWPPGTRPPGPAPDPGTPAQWQEALDDYRAHIRHRMARDDEETP